MARGLLIVNPHAGRAGPSSNELVGEAQRRGLDVHVLDGSDAADVARSTDADVIGIAGGDGSCAAVAQVCVDRDLPLVCVPTGIVPSEWHDRTATRLQIDAARPVLRVAIDGEPAELAPPILFEVQPAALRLLVPS